MSCALELGMRAMRDAIDKYPAKAPSWDPFVPETHDLGLVAGLGHDGSLISETDRKTEPQNTTDQSEFAVQLMENSPIFRPPC